MPQKLIKPFSVRIEDELKAPLQMWAMNEDRSTNYIILRILREAVNKKFGYATQVKKRTA